MLGSHPGWDDAFPRSKAFVVISSSWRREREAVEDSSPVPGFFANDEDVVVVESFLMVFLRKWWREKCSVKTYDGQYLSYLIIINVFIVLKPILFHHLQHDAMSLPVASCSGTERCMRRHGNCKVEILGLLDQINVRLVLRQSDRRTMAHHRIVGKAHLPCRHSPDTEERTRETCARCFCMRTPWLVWV